LRGKWGIKINKENNIMKNKIKKVLKSAVIGAAMLGLAGTAQAATEINLYGASAQYLFWNDAADGFLTAKGCSTVQQAEDAAGKSGITRGYACTGLPGSPDVIIRYKSKASYDGIRAMKGIDPDNQCPVEGSLYRPMADENNTDSVSYTHLTLPTILRV